MKFNKFDKILLIMCLACTIIIWWNYNKYNQKLDSIKMEAKLMVQIPKFHTDEYPLTFYALFPSISVTAFSARCFLPSAFQ